MKRSIAMAGLFFVLPVCAVEKHPCVIPGSAVDIALRQALEQDSGFDEKNWDRAASRLELIENAPVSGLFAEQLAQEDAASEPEESKQGLYKGMLTAYSSNNTRNLIVRYIYFNKQGKKNVYIGSALVDDYECSVNFKGYLTVSREF
ncbi:hypothetical protein [[Erwinia] mediterraneensis]|uniref:hypothetical protein n=1 Tax=[Erwinia] mediterraneensis TaxID=2161819 RepID=UPI0010320659|nr:hypothetical protein [[Erwinia] mediterraneensis]